MDSNQGPGFSISSATEDMPLVNEEGVGVLASAVPTLSLIDMDGPVEAFGVRRKNIKAMQECRFSHIASQNASWITNRVKKG